jgi:hypothetical protein
MKGKVLCVVLGLLIGLSLPAVATAQNRTQDKLAKARDHFNRAKKYFDQKQYESALKELEAAYLLDPKPQIVYNIGLVHEKRGDLESAIRYFRSYLLQKPKAKNRKKVKRRIKQLTARMKRNPSGYIEVTSDPSGATVRISGRVVGQTPMQAHRFRSGIHEVQVSLEGHQTHRERVLVVGTRANPSRMNVILRDRASSVLITTTPTGSTVSIHRNGQRVWAGTCPCNPELSGGRYQLRITKPGYMDLNITVVKEPGKRLQLPSIALVPVQTMGQLIVESGVVGAEIRVDGTTVGRTPLRVPLRLRPGQVTIIVAASGYRPWRGLVNIVTGKTVTVQALLDPLNGAGGGGAITTVESSGMSAQSIWGWVTTSVGIATILGGGGMTAWALYDQYLYDNGTYFRLADQSIARKDMTRAEALALEEEAQLFMNISTGLYAGGGALLATGLFLILTDDDDEAEPATGFSKVLFDWKPRLTITPLPGGATMQLSISFR